MAVKTPEETQALLAAGREGKTRAAWQGLKDYEEELRQAHLQAIEDNSGDVYALEAARTEVLELLQESPWAIKTVSIQQGELHGQDEPISESESVT